MKEFTPDLARALCSLLKRKRPGSGSGGVLRSSTDGRFREACPEVATSATMREGLLFYQLDRMRLGSLYRSPALAFQVPEYFGEIQVLRPRFLEAARESNVRVQVWTVNEEEDLARILKLGVDGILTDYPNRLLRLMGRLAPEAVEPFLGSSRSDFSDSRASFAIFASRRCTSAKTVSPGYSPSSFGTPASTPLRTSMPSSTVAAV